MKTFFRNTDVYTVKRNALPAEIYTKAIRLNLQSFFSTADETLGLYLSILSSVEVQFLSAYFRTLCPQSSSSVTRLSLFFLILSLISRRMAK